VSRLYFIRNSSVPLIRCSDSTMKSLFEVAILVSFRHTTSRGDIHRVCRLCYENTVSCSSWYKAAWNYLHLQTRSKLGLASLQGHVIQIWIQTWDFFRGICTVVDPCDSTLCLKKWATFIVTITLAVVDHFSKIFTNLCCHHSPDSNLVMSCKCQHDMTSQFSLKKYFLDVVINQ